jgi:hypothetical protein
MKKILIGLGVLGGLVGIFLVVVALQPSEYRVTRSALLPAPPAAVFPHANDLHKWQAWSPWAKKDPEAKNTFEGPSAGTGAIFRWSGNREVGKGSMTITESRPSELVRIRLDFIDPFPGTSDVEFTFKPEGAGTTATWTIAGKHDFAGKAVCLFMDMDGMIGADFEAGFDNLKKVLEAEKKK